MTGRDYLRIAWQGRNRGPSLSSAFPEFAGLSTEHILSKFMFILPYWASMFKLLPLVLWMGTANAHDPIFDNFLITCRNAAAFILVCLQWLDVEWRALQAVLIKEKMSNARQFLSDLGSRLHLALDCYLNARNFVEDPTKVHRSVGDRYRRITSACDDLEDIADVEDFKLKLVSFVFCHSTFYQYAELYKKRRLTAATTIQKWYRTRRLLR